VDKVIVVSAAGRRLEGHTVNVSANGMKVVGVHGLKKGETIEIMYGSRAFRGKVAWAESDSCGLQFSDAVSTAQLVDAGLVPTAAGAIAA
jgi:PilZ domain-containing protein